VIDLSKLTANVQQVFSLANIGFAAILQGSAYVNKIIAAAKARGYEVDTRGIAELLADIDRRLALIEEEERAEKGGT
jgi:hypothetical protein